MVNDRRGNDRTAGDEAPVEGRPSVVPGAKRLTPQVLLQRFGRCAVTVIEHFVAGVAPDALVTDGRRMGNDRIVRDGARIITAAGNAVEKLDGDQRALLPMVTGQLLAAASTALAMADEQQAALDAGRATASTTKRSSVARTQTLVTRAKSRRKILRSALVTAACGDAAWLTRIDEAAGKGSKPADLARSLTGLVAVGRDLRAKLEADGIEHNLSDAYFAGMLKLAEQTRTMGSVVEGTETGAAGQGAAKRAGGVCLWFLKRLVDAFDAANEADPSIARLQVYSLRSSLRRSGRKKKPSPPVPAPNPT